MKNKFLTFLLVLLIVLITPNSCRENTIPVNASNLIYCGDPNNNKIYLTFDDGYPYKNISKIVDTLIEHDIPATFFLEGDFLVHHSILINKMINNNLTIGCHTMDHVPIINKSNYSFLKDLDEYEETYEAMTGEQLPKFFRPPEGKINEEKKKLLIDRGYLIFMWDISYYDYNPYDDQGTSYAYKYITTRVENGSIILMHTLTKSNADVLESVIKNLQSRGFEFSSLYDFL